MQKLSEMIPNMARRAFPTNPNLVDKTGDADSDFENLDFLFFGSQLKFLDLQTRSGPGLGWGRSSRSLLLHHDGKHKYEALWARTRDT